MRTRDFAATVTIMTLAGAAFAGPAVGSNTSGSTSNGNASGIEQAGNDYIDVIVLESSVPSVRPDETVSIALNAWNLASGEIGTYNDLGDVPVLINGGPVSIGTNPLGVAIMADVTESEATGTFTRRIQVAIETADGSALLPFGTQLDNQQVQLLSWQVGVSDLIEFGNWIDTVSLNSATMFGSFDGGTSFSFQQNIIQLFQQGLSQWDITGAFDTGTTTITDTSGGAGFNSILLDYTFSAIPAPAATIVLLAGAAGFTRRRRS